MSEEAGAAPAAAEPVAVPEAPSEAPEQTEFEVTPRGSLDRAFDAVEQSDAAQAELAKSDDVDTVAAKETPDSGPARDEKTGKFKAKDAAPEAPAPDEVKNDDAPPVEGDGGPDADKAEVEGVFSEPPSRFSPDAKAAWKDAPAPVQAEIHRAVKELEQGIEKYRPGAEEWEGLAEFDALAKQSNTTVKNALTNYVQADRILNQDPVKGLEHVAQMYGLSLRDVAAQITGQPVDQAQAQNDQTIRELRQQLAAVQNQVGSVTTSIQAQREQAALREIQAFANEHPRFEELQSEIETQLKANFSLEEAYERAERLNPVPAPPAAAVAVAPTPEPAAQPGKGSLSLTGAPSSGSNPADRKPPSSARSALDRSFSELGIG